MVSSGGRGDPAWVSLSPAIRIASAVGKAGFAARAPKLRGSVYATLGPFFAQTTPPELRLRGRSDTRRWLIGGVVILVVVLGLFGAYASYHGENGVEPDARQDSIRAAPVSCVQSVGDSSMPGLETISYECTSFEDGVRRLSMCKS